MHTIRQALQSSPFAKLTLRCIFYDGYSWTVKAQYWKISIKILLPLKMRPTAQNVPENITENVNMFSCSTVVSRADTIKQIPRINTCFSPGILVHTCLYNVFLVYSSYAVSSIRSINWYLNILIMCQWW